MTTRCAGARSRGDLVAAAVAVAVACGTACTAAFPESPALTCRTIDLDVPAVRARRGEVPTLSARLTSSGSPVAGWDVTLGVGVRPSGEIVWSRVVETDRDGFARLPMTEDGGTGRLQEALANGVTVVASLRIEEPADGQGPPHYCDVSSNAGFEVVP